MNLGGSASVTHSTLWGNSAQDGAGIYTSSGSTLVATIVAKSGSGKDCAGVSPPVTDDGYNLDDDGSCGLSGTSLSDTPAGLNPAGLQNNGGPTQTIALESGSPAINHVTAPSDCTGTDQRGAPWPTPCDIGAVGGLVATTSCVTTNGQEPLTLSPASVSGLEASINGGVNAPQGTLLTGIDWNWGDGTVLTGCLYFPQSHTYQEAGTYNVVVTTTFTNGTQQQASEDVTVSGSGTTATSVSVNPSSLSFGTVAAGSASSPQTVTLTDTGPDPISIGNVEVTTGSTAPSEFGTPQGENGCYGTSLQPGLSCAEGVVFAPTSSAPPGSVTQTLSFAVNDEVTGANLDQAVSLTGVTQVIPSDLSWGYCFDARAAAFYKILNDEILTCVLEDQGSPNTIDLLAYGTVGVSQIPANLDYSRDGVMRLPVSA
jgi:hypothetical protein